MTVESKDLVKIIEACGKNGVSHFKCGGIDIGFNGFVFQTEKDYPNTVPVVPNTVADPKFQDQQDYEMGADEDENLMVTDPFAYEENLFKGDMEESETHMDAE